MKTNSSAPKGKEKSEKTGIGAKGGTTKMFGKSGAAQAESGVASDTYLPKFDKAPAKGGKTGVMGKQRGAAPVVAGQISLGGRTGNNKFAVSGGGKAMAPFTGATTAKPR